MELILAIIIIAALLPVAVAALAIELAVFIGVWLVSLCVGWIPIYLVVSDPAHVLNEGFVGTWAYFSLWIYGISGLGFVGVLTFKPDPDGLPPMLKFLALFYASPPRRSAHALAERGVQNTEESFRNTIKAKPSHLFQTLIEARQLRRAAKHMQADSERLRSAAAVTKAALEMERLKERNATLEEILRNRQNQS